MSKPLFAWWRRGMLPVCLAASVAPLIVFPLALASLAFCLPAPAVAAPPVRVLLTRSIAPAPDGADAIRVSIYGDKSGSQVQIRLLSAAEDGVLSGYYAAPPIAIDFDGWKTVVLPLADFTFGSDINPESAKDGLASKETLNSSTRLQLAITSATSKLFFDDLGWAKASAAPTEPSLAPIETFEDGSAAWKPAGDYDQIRSVSFGVTKVAQYVKNGGASLQVVVRPQLLTQRQIEKPVLDKRLKAQPSQPYAVYSRTPFDPIYAESVPTAAEAKTIPTLSITACPGESEPASFAVYSVKEIKGATVRLSGAILAANKTSLPASAVDLRVVRVGQGLNPPELLMKDDREPLTGPLPVVRLTGEPTTDIAAETSKQFWVTVRVPANQAPGLYKGKLVFTANGIKPAGIPFTVTVADMTLKTAFLQYGVDLKTRLAGTGETSGGGAVAADTLAAMLKDIGDHGVKLIMVADTSANLQQELALYKQANLSQVGPVVVASLQNGTDVASVEGMKGQAGLPPSFDIYYVLPEGAAQQDAAVAAFGEAVKAANRSGLVVAVVQSMEDYKSLVSALNDTTGERLAPIYTISSDYAQKILAAGKRSTPNRDYWTWNLPSQSALRNRLFAGFLLYKTGPGLYGAFPSPYGYVPPGVNPFAAFDPSFDPSSPRPQMAAFPVQSGVLDTIQWEAISAGVDDIRYIGALKGYIRELKDAKKRKDATDAAEAYLAAIASKPLLQLTPAQHQANRLGILRAALKLKTILDPGTKPLPTK